MELTTAEGARLRRAAWQALAYFDDPEAVAQIEAHRDHLRADPVGAFEKRVLASARWADENAFILEDWLEVAVAWEAAPPEELDEIAEEADHVAALVRAIGGEAPRNILSFTNASHMAGGSWGLSILELKDHGLICDFSEEGYVIAGWKLSAGHDGLVEALKAVSREWGDSLFSGAETLSTYAPMTVQMGLPQVWLTPDV